MPFREAHTHPHGLVQSGMGTLIQGCWDEVVD